MYVCMYVFIYVYEYKYHTTRVVLTMSTLTPEAINNKDIFFIFFNHDYIHLKEK